MLNRIKYAMSQCHLSQASGTTNGIPIYTIKIHLLALKDIQLKDIQTLKTKTILRILVMVNFLKF